MRTFILFSLLLVTTVSCEKIFMKPNAKTDNRAIFHEYAKLVKEKYAMLAFKGVDIDHLRDSIDPFITNDMSPDSLFAKTAIITNRLRDGHSALIGVYTNSSSFATFDLYAGYPVAFNDTILQNHYVGNSVAPNIKEITSGETVLAYYGFLPQHATIAYIRIPSFNVEITDEQLESIFSEIKNATGCIIDVRGNGGGDPSLATKFASYFMDQTTYTGFERFKTGPGATDFQDSPSNVTPASSSNRFLKPVAVLTDRGCYSATTTLCYNLNPLNQVTFIGQRTGGGSGSVADGVLANGWQWSLSTSEFIDHLGNHLDDGIDPDMSVSFDNTVQTTDEIIEAAIQHLQ